MQHSEEKDGEMLLFRGSDRSRAGRQYGKNTKRRAFRSGAQEEIKSWRGSRRAKVQLKIHYQFD